MIILTENTIIDRIQVLLEFNHWSLYKLAKEANLSYSSLNNIFNRRTCPSIITLEKICKGFNISLSEFFAFEENPLRSNTLTEEQQDLINSYEALSNKDKELLKAYLQGFRKK